MSLGKVIRNPGESAFIELGDNSMDHRKKITAKTAAVLLSIPAYVFCIAGCGEMPEKADSAAKETVVQMQKDTTITVGSIRCDVAARELTVTDAIIGELAEILPQLPQLKTLTLEGTVPEISGLAALKESYPDLQLICGVTISGNIYSTDAQVLDFADASVSVEELNGVLPLFSNLQELNLSGTDLSDEELMSLADSNPQVPLRCELPLAGQRFMTDSVQIDISGSEVTAEEVDQMLPYFPNLEKLDMSFCGIGNEEMDALNQRHPEVNIVWTLKIGEARTRTDAIYFYPAEFNYYPTNEEMKQLRYCPDMIAVDIGHTRATDCEFLWYMPNVKYLILADTGITDITPVGNLKELIYLELFNLKINDYSPLLNCTKLQDLNIGTTYADPEPLSKMTWLHNLQWHRSDQNPETKEDVLKLPEQLPDTNVVLFPKKKARNIGGPWRYLPNYYVFRDIIGATYFNQDQIPDYWGEEDAARIMACESGKSFCAYTLAEIIRERIDNNEPIIGIKNIGSEKAEILYESLLNAEPDAMKR